MENHLQQIMLGVKSAAVICGKQMSMSTVVVVVVVKTLFKKSHASLVNYIAGFH